MTAVHVVVPEEIDDPHRPSGGNAYDRRVCAGLSGLGWSVLEHPVRTRPGAAADLDAVLARIPDGGLALLDGLVTWGAPVSVAHARRLRLVVLVHLPLGVAADGARPEERALLSAVAAVVTTSQWSRQWLLDTYAIAPARVRVAEPGAEPADLAAGTPSGGALLCVGPVTPPKGQQVLVTALTEVADLAWRCTCVGALDLDPCFVEELRRRAERSGIADRIRFAGPLAGAALEAAYAGSDLLVSASRAETYGMVVTEALARGLPVVAAAVGGLPEALGRADDGERPGLLVPPDDPRALAAALRRWLADATERERLRGAARGRRRGLPDWAQTSRRIADVLSGIAG